MADKYTYEYPRPALTADCVIFGFDGNALNVLLIERGVEPYKGYWALPGGFMRMDETIDECARRELMEETQVKDIYIEQFRVFSSTNRDPRGRVVTVAFIALVRPEAHAVKGGDDARVAMWFNCEEIPPLAFDHEEILAAAREHLREVLRVRPVAFNLLNLAFTIDELRRVYEVINNTTYDRRNFTRKAMQTGTIVDADLPDIQEELNTYCSTLGCGEYDMDCEQQAAPSRRRRLFRFSEKKNDNDEGSIKDLFNF